MNSEKDEPPREKRISVQLYLVEWRYVLKALERLKPADPAENLWLNNVLRHIREVLDQ